MKWMVGLWLVLALAGTTSAQTREELARDAVTVRDGKFLYDDYSLCTIDARKLLAARTVATSPQEPAQERVTFQIHTTAEAKADGWISRDNFVGTIAAVSTFLQIGLFSQLPNIDVTKALGALTCKTVKEPIGRPDLDIKLFMTPDGMQIETTSAATGETNRITTEWQQ